MTILALSRRNLIEKRLANGQQVVASDLADEFAVSEDAIRRDLRALASEGICKRVYGGAVPLYSPSRSMSVRKEQAVDRKTQLAASAMALIQAGDLIFLDSSSTNLVLAQNLPEDRGITVATNSIEIAAALLLKDDIPFVFVGGSINRLIGGSVDAAAIETISSMNVALCFLGACAVSPGLGVSVHDHADSIFKKALIRASARTVVLATSEKFEERAPYRIAISSEISHLVVENDISDTIAMELERSGYSLIRASDI